MFELAKLLAERLSVTVCYGYPQDRYQTRLSLYENTNARVYGVIKFAKRSLVEEDYGLQWYSVRYRDLSDSRFQRELNLYES